MRAELGILGDWAHVECMNERRPLLAMVLKLYFAKESLEELVKESGS